MRVKLPLICSAVLTCKALLFLLLALPIFTALPALVIFTCSSWLALLAKVVVPAAEVFSTGADREKPPTSLIAPLVAVSVTSLAAMLPLFKAISSVEAVKLALVALSSPPLTLTL